MGDRDVMFEDDRGNLVNQTGALLRIAYALEGLSVQVKHLGLADAATPMGAIESHGVIVREAAQSIADSLESVAQAVESHE